MDTTADASLHSSGGRHARPAQPGVVVLTDAGWPVSKATPVPRDGLMLGRGTPNGWFENDGWVSRAHLRVRRVAGCWVFEDAGSRNGSFLRGAPIVQPETVGGNVVFRIGRSLCWAVENVTMHLDSQVIVPETGPILGAALRSAWTEIQLATRSSDSLLLGGPSGAGKELAARAYHRSAHRETRDGDAPFVAVNCATIPHGLAERLLFGAQRGAYSGADRNTQGYVQAADGGTLFLDEVAELEPSVQAKLLRVLETREVTPLGSARATPVRIRVCAATLKDLREEVAAGRFREDLYYRLGRPSVVLPGLCDRLDEVPFLIVRTLKDIDAQLEPATDLIEQCTLRAWPGNVRELIGELRHAAFAALHADQTTVSARFLARDAGIAIAPAPAVNTNCRSERAPASAQNLSDSAIRAALEREGNNVSAAARALGLHRNQLRRWINKQDSPK